jgi:hypothetical protein
MMGSPGTSLVILVCICRVFSSDISYLHLPSNSSIGDIVKVFPDLDGLTLLPSPASSAFYLLNSGHLMLADTLAFKAGTGF